jgi:hypothetical protein
MYEVHLQFSSSVGAAYTNWGSLCLQQYTRVVSVSSAVYCGMVLDMLIHVDKKDWTAKIFVSK